MWLATALAILGVDGADAIAIVQLPGRRAEEVSEVAGVVQEARRAIPVPTDRACSRERHVQLLVAVAQLVLQCDARCHVPKRGDDGTEIRILQVVDGCDLDALPLAIALLEPSLSEQHAAWLLQQPLQLGRHARRVVGVHERHRRELRELLLRVARHAFDGGAHVQDASIRIERDDGVVAVLDELPHAARILRGSGAGAGPDRELVHHVPDRPSLIRHGVARRMRPGRAGKARKPV
jgi:hypothetical protein